MPYTPLQNVRKARATNQGQNKKLANQLRYAAKMLELKGREEFTRGEISILQSVRKMLSARLYMNALTKAMQITLDGNLKRVGAKYVVELNPKDL